MGLLDKIKSGFQKTKDGLKNNIDNVIKSFKKIDDDFWDELEETLIMSDLGVSATLDIIENLKKETKEKKIIDTELVSEMLKNELTNLMTSENIYEEKFPKVILVMGVNGVGKTTTIGKLAHNYKEEGKKVILAAADTFRAAAIEQLEVWAKRVDTPIVKHNEGADPGAVIFDAISSGKAKNADVIICDTAGRLHNKVNLMNELEKVTKIVKGNAEGYDLEILLVLDANTGQNAVEQAKSFSSVTDINGIVLTKIDSSAKGGIVVAIKKELNIPIKYVGVGEGIDDLQKFSPKDFIDSIFD
ncbi:MAG: signal recognition particle-docking protein FtsY [Clostridia bacterium]|nr:signal recognition particle-docking protein FtsY [Clostridia bacterium]